jgi:hypothetical protein
VLAADAETHQARGNPAKDRESIQQAQGERNLVQHRLADDERRQHAVVDELLPALDDAGRE